MLGYLKNLKPSPVEDGIEDAIENGIAEESSFPPEAKTYTASGATSTLQSMAKRLSMDDTDDLGFG